jgi:hypothetical protein
MSTTGIEAKKREHFNAAFAKIARALELAEKMFEGDAEFKRADTMELTRLAREAYAAAQSLDCLAAGLLPPKIGDRP